MLIPLAFEHICNASIWRLDFARLVDVALVVIECERFVSIGVYQAGACAWGRARMGGPM